MIARVCVMRAILSPSRNVQRALLVSLWQSRNTHSVRYMHDCNVAHAESSHCELQSNMRPRVRKHQRHKVRRRAMMSVTECDLPKLLLTTTTLVVLSLTSSCHVIPLFSHGHLEAHASRHRVCSPGRAMLPRPPPPTKTALHMQSMWKHSSVALPSAAQRILHALSRL